jgi:hypothetical protein
VLIDMTEHTNVGDIPFVIGFGGMRTWNNQPKHDQKTHDVLFHGTNESNGSDRTKQIKPVPLKYHRGCLAKESRGQNLKHVSPNRNKEDNEYENRRPGWIHTEPWRSELGCSEFDRKMHSL